MTSVDAVVAAVGSSRLIAATREVGGPPKSMIEVASYGTKYEHIGN
jgi:hypothetical protein